MAITEPTQFNTQKKQQSYKPIVFINFDEPAKYWASRFIDISEETATPANWSNGTADYEDVLATGSIGGISQSVARFGGLATLGGVSVQLVNLGYADFLNTYPYLEGQEVEVYLIFDDGTPLVFSESLQVFTGLIESLGIDESRLTITLSPPELTGEFIFTEHADAPTVPFSYEGERFPVIYGDHSRYMNRLLDSSITNLQAGNNMVQAELLGTAPDEATLLEIYYKLSDAELYEWTDEDIWIEDPATGRLWNIDPSSISINIVSSTGGPVTMVITIDTSSPITVHDYVFATQVVLGSGSPSPYDDMENAGDQDNASYAYKTGTFTGAAYNYSMDILFSEIQYGDNVTLPSQYEVYSRSSSTGSLHSNIITDAGTQSISGYASTRYYNSGYTTELSKAVGVSVSGSTPGTLNDRIYEIFKRVELELDFNQKEYKVFVGCKGNKDDSSGTYTGTANALIESPVNMLHHLAINYFGKSSSELDSSITSVASDLSKAREDWKVSKIYLEPAGYKDTVDDLSKKAMIFTWIDNFNKLKGRAIIDTEDEEYPSGSTTAADSDRASDSPTVTAGAIPKHWLRSVRPANKTKITDFANEITLEYFVNPYSGAYQLEQTEEDTASQSAYKATVSKIINNDLIRDPSTAAYYLALYLLLAAYRCWYAQCSGRLDAVNLEVGDIVDLEFTWDSFLSDEARIWQILDISKELVSGIGIVNFKAVERLIL